MRLPYTISILLVVLILGAANVFMAQDSGISSPLPDNPQQSWLPEQLNNLVAPIALYPDPLLGQMLVASTYPLEVVEANQWLQRNSGLQGQALIDAAKQQSWDPSIQALIVVPDALEKLNQDIRWTTDLGNAFLAQQDDVMHAIQTMRLRAQADGHLSSTTQQVVQTEDQGGQQAIEILPASPDIIYVPVYDPRYIWGPPAYGYYPALYYPSFGFDFGSGFDLALYFDGWGGWSGWGWGPNWYGDRIVVNNLFFNRYGFHDRFLAGNRGRTIWRHDPDHRMNIPYANPQLAEQFKGMTTGAHSSRWAIPGQTGTQIIRGTSGQGIRSQSQSSAQTSPQNEYSSELHRNVPRVVPFGQEAERNYNAQQPNRPATEGNGQGSQAERFRDRGQDSHQSHQERMPSNQAYRAPQAQRSQAPQMYRSNPGIATARTGGNSGLSSSRGFGQNQSGRSYQSSGNGGHHR